MDKRVNLLYLYVVLGVLFKALINLSLAASQLLWQRLWLTSSWPNQKTKGWKTGSEFKKKISWFTEVTNTTLQRSTCALNSLYFPTLCNPLKKNHCDFDKWTCMQQFCFYYCCYFLKDHLSRYKNSLNYLNNNYQKKIFKYLSILFTIYLNLVDGQLNFYLIIWFV